MKKSLSLLILGSLIACNSAEETEQATQEEIVQEVDTVLYVDEETAEILEPTVNEDSLRELYKDLEQHLLDQKGQREDMRDQLYVMERQTFDVYSGGSERWYFGQDFSLLFYEMDFGAEGGYGEEAFWRIKDDLFWLTYYEESDVDNPTSIIQKHDETGRVKLASCMMKNYLKEGEPETFKVPDLVEFDSFPDEIIRKHKAEGFTPGARYTYEKSEMVDSEYGGQESSGYRIILDSALFVHFYGE